MHAIVAGANGFLGKNLVKALHDRGYQVTALSRTFDNDIRSIARCICVEDAPYQELARMLFQGHDEVWDKQGHNKQYDCFYDFAWNGTSGEARGDYNTQIENIRTTCEYVKLAHSIGCQRFVYASSINEMETYEYLQNSDNIKPSFGYIYGAAKLAAHLMAETLSYQIGLPFIPIIITNIYGIGDTPKRLICSSIKKLIAGEHCSFTEGEQTYDFIYLTDAINSIIEIGEKGRAFERYYIGGGHPKPLREFLTQMRDIVAPNAKLGFGDITFHGVDIDYSQFDLKKVEKDTGYKNKISFEDGIATTYDWLTRTPLSIFTYQKQ